MKAQVMVHSSKSVLTKTLSLVTIALFLATLLPGGLLAFKTASADSSAPVQQTQMAPTYLGFNHWYEGNTQGCEADYDTLSNGSSDPKYNFTVTNTFSKEKSGEHSSGFAYSPSGADNGLIYIRDGAQLYTTETANRPQDYFVVNGQQVHSVMYTETAPTTPGACSTKLPVCHYTAADPQDFSIPAASSININVGDVCTQPGGSASELHVDSAYSSATTTPNAQYPNNKSYSFPSSDFRDSDYITYYAPTNCYGSTNVVKFVGDNIYGGFYADSTSGGIAKKTLVFRVTSTQPKGGKLPLCSSLN